MVSTRLTQRCDAERHDTVGPKFTRSSQYRTHVHRHNDMGAQDWWGWLSTASGRGPVSENARETREGFRILTGGDRVRRPDSCGTDGDLHGPACAVESQTDSGTQSSHPEADGVVETKGGDGHL